MCMHNQYTHQYAQYTPPYTLAMSFLQHIKCFQVMMAYSSAASGPPPSHTHHSEYTPSHSLPHISQPLTLRAMLVKITAGLITPNHTNPTSASPGRGEEVRLSLHMKDSFNKDITTLICLVTESLTVIVSNCIRPKGVFQIYGKAEWRWLWLRV